MVTDTIRIRYRADSSVQAVVLVSVDSGATWQTLSSGSTSGVDDSGWTTFSWVAEENVNDGETGVVALRVRVCDTSGVPCIPCGHDLLVQADTAVPISVMCLDSGPYLTNDTLVLRYQADTVLVHASVWVSLDSGGTWKQPDGWASLPDDSGWVSYSWVPARDSIPGQTVGAVDYRVRVCDSSGAPCVSCGSPVPLHRYPLALTAPGSTDTFMVGDTLTVRWGLDTALIDTCVLAFSVDSGATWYTIARLGGEPAAAGTFLWHVPETIDGSDLMSTSACVVRVMSADSAFAAYSEGTFTIERPEGEPDDEPGDDSGCGCGTGTGLALIPPVGIRLASAYRRRRRRKKARGSR